MTTEQWMTLLGQTLAPIVGALVLAASVIIGAVATGVAGRIKAYFDSKGAAAASQIVTDANVRVQAAMANQAGQIALEIQTGKLQVTDLAAVKVRALQAADAIKGALPDAVDVLRPAEGAIANAIVGKLGTLVVGAAPVQGAAP